MFALRFLLVLFAVRAIRHFLELIFPGYRRGRLLARLNWSRLLCTGASILVVALLLAPAVSVAAESVAPTLAEEAESILVTTLLPEWWQDGTIAPPENTDIQQPCERTAQTAAATPAPGLGDENEVYVCTQDRVLRTSDISATNPSWDDITPSGVSLQYNPNPIVDCIPDPLMPHRGMWVVAKETVWRTYDLSSANPTWVEVLLGHDGTSLKRIHASASNPGTFFLLADFYTPGEGDFLALSTSGTVPSWYNEVAVAHTHDWGATWHWESLVSAGETSSGFEIVDRPGVENISVLVSLREGYPSSLGDPLLYRSTDGGHSFSAGAQFSETLDAIYVPADSPQTIYVGSVGSSESATQTISAFLFRSQDDGDTWTDIAPVTPTVPYTRGAPGPYTIAGSPLAPGEIALLGQAQPAEYVEDPHVYHSTDGGASWEVRHSFAKGMTGLGISYHDSDRLYALHQGLELQGLIYLSEDGGDTWVDKTGNLSGSSWHPGIAIWDTTYDPVLLSSLAPQECPFGSMLHNQSWVGGPINTRTGNYHYSQEDFSIPVLGGPIHFERSYSSQAITGTTKYTRPLGYGWTHNYDMQLILSGTVGSEPGTVVLQSCHGSRFRFEEDGDGDGVYEPFPGVWATLTRTLETSPTYFLRGVDQSTYVFTSTGQLVEIRDPQGHALSLSYSADQLNKIEDTTGQRYLTFTYDGDGRMTAVQDSTSRTIRFGYQNDDLTVVTDTRTSPSTYWTYVYSGTHLLYEVRDPEHRIVERTEFDDQGRAVRQWNGLLEKPLEINYGITGTVTITDHVGHVSRDHYDYRGTLAMQEQAGDVSARTYDVYFNWTAVTDPNSNTTHYTFNAMGLPEVVTDALENVTQMVYDDRSHLVETTDALNRTSRYQWEGNLLTVITDTTLRTMINTYQEGLLVQTVDHGVTTTYDYNDFGQRTAITDALRHVTIYGYDEVGRLITTTVAASTPLQRMTVNAYDAADNLIRVTENVTDNTSADPNTYNLTTEYEYDGAGRLITETDPMNHVTVYDYDAAGRLAEMTVNWDDTVTGHGPDNDMNVVTTYEYDGVGNLVTETNTLGQMSIYDYDAANRLVAVTENYTDTTTERNYLDAYNLVTEYGYDPVGNQILVTNTLGTATRNWYDDANRLVSTTANYSSTIFPDHGPDGLWNITTWYGYDAVGNRTHITDTYGHVTLTEYDPLNRPLTVTTNATATSSTERLTALSIYDDTAGRLTARVQLSGTQRITTSYEYDALGRTIAVIDALTGTTRYEYDALGRRRVLTDPAGVVTTFTYDPLGRLVAQENELGDTTRYAYDALGRRTWMTDANHIVTRYEYDALGRLTAVTENFTATQTSDAETNVRTEYTYDVLGRLRTVTDAELVAASGVTHTTVYTYDALGRLTAEEDALGHVTRYAYDALGRRTAVVYPDAGGVFTVTTRYNRLNWPTQVVYPTVGDAAGYTVSTAYDRVGNRTVMTDASGTTEYVYDGLYRPLTITHSVAGAVGYRYDAAGNRARLIYPDGEVVTYGYDEVNRLAQVTAWDSLSATYDYDLSGRLEDVVLSNGVTTTYDYDDAGRLDEIDHVGHWSLAAYTYTLDAVGNRTEVQEQVLPPTPRQYLPLIMRDYESGGEEMMGEGMEGGTESPFLSPLPAPGIFNSPLSSSAGGGMIAGGTPAAPETGPFPLDATLLLTAAILVAVVVGQKKDRRWAYVVAAAMTALALVRVQATLAEDTASVDILSSSTFLSPRSVPVGGCDCPLPIEGREVISYTYDHLNRLTTGAYSSGECYEYDYDRVGNRETLTHTVAMTNTTATSYDYDDANRLTEVGTTAYTWDQRGNLTHDGTFTYTFDAAGRMVRAESDALTLTLVYTYSADGLLMARRVNTDVITFTWDVALGLPQVLETSDGAQYVHGLDLIAEYRDDMWAYPLGDALGSVRQWTDEDGFVTYRGSYTPFGVALSSEGSTESAWGYTGELFDASLGDLYLRARWMDVSTGRFTRRDPWRGSLWQPGSMQGYGYVFGNPINWVDPTGYLPKQEIIQAFGVATWDDVKAFFQEGGGLEGKWGYLVALRDLDPDERLRMWDTLMTGDVAVAYWNQDRTIFAGTVGYENGIPFLVDGSGNMVSLLEAGRIQAAMYGIEHWRDHGSGEHWHLPARGTIPAIMPYKRFGTPSYLDYYGRINPDSVDWFGACLDLGGLVADTVTYGAGGRLVNGVQVAAEAESIGAWLNTIALTNDFTQISLDGLNGQWPVENFWGLGLDVAGIWFPVVPDIVSLSMNFWGAVEER